MQVGDHNRQAGLRDRGPVRPVALRSIIISRIATQVVGYRLSAKFILDRTKLR